MMVAVVCGVSYSCYSYSLKQLNHKTNTYKTNKKKKNKSHHFTPKYSLVSVSSLESRGYELLMKEYSDHSKDFILSSSNSVQKQQPPRWFCPLDCAPTRDDHDRQSPLLLYLPGIDGTGVGLILHHQSLAKYLIYGACTSHTRIGHLLQACNLTYIENGFIPNFQCSELVELVERTVQSESNRLPNRPIYLVSESFGACLALSVAARNPDIDLVLILANSATCYNKSPLLSLLPLLQIMPEQLYQTIPYAFSSLAGVPFNLVMSTLEKGLPLQDTVGEILKSIVALSSYLHVLIDNPLRGETLLWKLQILKEASTYANSRLHAVKAQTLILSSGRDLLLPSEEEGERLRQILPKCEIRRFSDCSHALFLAKPKALTTPTVGTGCTQGNSKMEKGVDLVTIIKSVSFYRRSRYLDYVSDYMPPTDSEIEKVFENLRWWELATAPVMLSTLENGNIVRDLSGIPSEGPVLFVGCHMLLGLEVTPLVAHLWKERNILMRGIGHPMMFRKLKDGLLPDLSTFDNVRLMGAVPVSPNNLYKLFASESHVLLYPGGVREALHRKGEEYKLFWPEQAEFVRMAARFGATIVPFGVVGEDDISQMIFDYDDLMKIPYLKHVIAAVTEESGNLRTDSKGEVTNQDVYMPIIVPKLPGRFYYMFGKPISTKGRKHELENKQQSHGLYLEIKSEVEKCLAFLKEKREHDPYRGLPSRMLYQSANGFDSQAPTFEL